MEGPINFTSEHRKEVFQFFESLLHNYQEPMYYEYIRGHVSKASTVVRKYVASKCKGEKLLEYFKLRKNYFIVENTEVQLIKNPGLGRRRVQSECTPEDSRGRKNFWKSDKARSERGNSYSPTRSDIIVVSRKDGKSRERDSRKDGKRKESRERDSRNEEMEHEDYAKKFFNDLVTRYGSVIPSSLNYDDLPKKVKRHLDLYYKKKVSNYFAHFPDKFSFDKEGKVFFKIHASGDSLNDSDPNETTIDKVSSNPSSASVPSVSVSKQPTPFIDPEIKVKYNKLDAMLFFAHILIKKKTSLPVDQLGGYLSQASKSLREFLKFNFKMLKNFFEESPSMFSINSSEEVTLIKSIRTMQLIVEKINRIMSKAAKGTISVQTMLSQVDRILCPIQISKINSNAINDNTCELEKIPLIAEVKSNMENQLKSPIVNSSSESTSYTSKDIEVNNKKVTDENVLYNCQNKTDESLRTVPSYSEIPVTESNKTGTLSENRSRTNSNVDKSSDLEDKVNQKSVQTLAQICDAEFILLQKDRAFIEFFLAFELFCLELTERDIEFTSCNEIKAIQYFIEVLSQPFLKNWSVKSVQGTIGKAPTEVSSFLKRKYKGDNFSNFFEEQPEFEVDGTLVRLSPSYQEIYSKRQTALSTSINQKSKWNLLKLYETTYYKDVFTQVAAFLHEICHFLQNKSKTKLSRLAGISTSSHKTLEWLKAIDGETLTKKIGNFLQQFSIFDLFNEDLVYLQQNNSSYIIIEILLKIVQNKIKSTSLFPVLRQMLNLSAINEQSDTKTFDLSIDKSYLLHEANGLLCKYCGIVKIVPIDVLLKIYEYNLGSRIIIDTLLRNTEYIFLNGNIYFKNETNAYINSENNNETSLTSAETNISLNKQINQLDLSQADVAKYNSPTWDSKEQIKSLGSKEVEIDSIENDLKISKNNESVNDTESIFTESSSENLNAACNPKKHTDSIEVFEDEIKTDYKNIKECNSEDDFDSIIADINSLTDEERHSYSQEEEDLDEDFDYVSTFAENDVEANDEVCSPSPLLDSCVKGNLPTEDLKTGKNYVTSTIEHYMDILNEVDEFLDIHENMCTDENGNDSSHLVITSPFQNGNGLNLYKKEAAIYDEENTLDILNNGKTKTVSPKFKENDFKVTEHQMENISQMKFKAESLAKIVIRNVNQSKIFVASPSIIFMFKKNYLSKLYGPLKCDNHVTKPSSETILIDNKAPNTSDDKNPIVMEISWNDKNTVGQKTLTHVSQEECSTNNLELSSNISLYNDEDEVSSKINFASNDNETVTIEYPLQPIPAEVVLLTPDSCIAVATIKSRKQNIYFLKCVFVCDHHYCCSDCFNGLKVSDTVSCFVPPTEISRKMWIAFMVSKENSTHFNEIDSFNDIINKQNREGCMNRSMCVNSKTISVQTVIPSAEFGCQTLLSSTEQVCQTSLSGDVKVCAITEDSVSQTNISVKCASIQTASETKSNGSQTDFSLCKKDVQSQTLHSGCIKEGAIYNSVFCQTEEARCSTNKVNTESQTISTGQVMITKYYHM